MPAQPFAFYNKMNGFVDKGRVVVVIYLNFSKIFDTIFHNILELKPKHCSMDEWIMNLEKSCLEDWAQRAVINGWYSGWRPVTSAVLHRSVLWLLLLNITDNSNRQHSHQVCKWCDSEATSQCTWEQSCLTGGPTQKRRSGLTGTLSNSTRTDAKNCSLKGIVLCSDMHWELPGWAEALEKGAGCPDEKQAEPEPEREKRASSRRWENQEKYYLLLASIHWKTSVPRYGPLVQKGVTNFSEFSSSHQDGLNWEWLLHAERLGEQVSFRQSWRWLWGHVTATLGPTVRSSRRCNQAFHNVAWWKGPKLRKEVLDWILDELFPRENTNCKNLPRQKPSILGGFG